MIDTLKPIEYRTHAIRFTPGGKEPESEGAKRAVKPAARIGRRFGSVFNPAPHDERGYKERLDSRLAAALTGLAGAGNGQDNAPLTPVRFEDAAGHYKAALETPPVRKAKSD